MSAADAFWDKFKTAMRWLFNSGTPGIAVMQAADTPEPEEIGNSSLGSTDSEPATSGRGRSVEGLRATQVYYRHGLSGDNSEISIWLYDGDSGESDDAGRWVEWAHYSLDKDEGILPTIDLEGNWERIFAQVTEGAVSELTVKCSPHSESSSTD